MSEEATASAVADSVVVPEKEESVENGSETAAASADSDAAGVENKEKVAAETAPEVPAETPPTTVSSQSSTSSDQQSLDELIQEDFMCDQTNERDNSFYKALLTGFQSLKEARDTKKTPLFATEPIMTQGGAGKDNIPSEPSIRPMPMHVTVNFVDPTTKPPGAPIMSPKPNNLLSMSRITAPQSLSQLQQPSSLEPVLENVFDKLSYIFQKDYGSTLRSVQYKNMRSGESDVISSIPVEMILTRTGNASGTGEAANVAWGGMGAGGSSSALTDPAEWHTGPFCHVYIAAIESMDHYRTKVRPSLQAFVSQLELSSSSNGQSSNNNAHNKSSTAVLGSPGGISAASQPSGAPYLIVYVPAGANANRKNPSTNNGSGNNDETNVSSGPVRRALASQFAKARERIANYQQDANNNTALDTSMHSKDSLGSGDVDITDDNPDAAAAALTLQALSQNEKLLYKKLVADFSNGKVCVLSKSSLTKLDGGGEGGTSPTNAAAASTITTTADSSAGMVLRTQEWNAFSRILGAVIVNGFRERCRRYNDELRRLDAQRAIAAQAAKSPTSGGGANPPESASSGGLFGGSSKPKQPQPPPVFNLGYFFLVKESLAFTYEQMQLPSEALLQYDEFRAFLPDLTDEEHQKALKRRRKSKALKADATTGANGPLVRLADAADFVNFRRRLRAEFDLTPILEIVRRYLFAREIRLLFKMEQPVEVISRSEAFAKHMYSVMLRGMDQCPPNMRKQRKSDAAKWVVQFAWDIKTTCETYLLPDSPSRESFTDTLSVDTPGSELTNESGAGSQSEQSIASRLGELLEMARLLFKELGDVELEEGNPLRKYEQSLPGDMFQAWEPWSAPDVSVDGKAKVPKFGRPERSTERQFLMENAFSSLDSFEKIYLDMAGAIVNLSRYGHRRRMAFRLQAELGEYLVRKGELAAAAAVFKSTVKIYRADQWDRCHFWRLFRLSYCQRATAAPTDYLKTLATCFSPRTATVAPIKALETLQTDLEKVIEHPAIGESKYGTIAFIETSIAVLETSSDESTMGTGVDRKQLIKRYCSVGETVTINITVSCHLPRAIELDSLKLFIVDFTTFSSIIENRESVEEEDAVKTIGLEKGVKLLPGRNSFTFEWAPSTAGQFILSTLEVVWKQGFFYYDSMELPAPLLGVDVLPSEPTHSLRIEPAYLVPGHDQEVRITFYSGLDLVTAGIIQLACSEGIAIVGPGEDIAAGEWKQGCEVQIGPCKPGETVVLKAHVRCALIENFSKDPITQMPAFDSAHGLSAKAFTKYLHAVADDMESANTQKMKSVLDAFAPILEKTALSIESFEALWIERMERLMINIDLMSNTPGHFSVSAFKLLLPPPLKLADGVDHNVDLLENSVSDGDRISLSFECIVGSRTESSLVEDSALQVKLTDYTEKVFSLDLSLDLSAFYLQLLDNNNPKASGQAKASLKLAVDEGAMGEPIKFMFTVETQAEGDIVYSVDASGTDWLVSGKVNGSMQRSGFMSLGFMGCCELIGIPAVAGNITSFPKMQIGTVSMNDGYIPLKVDYTTPDSFRSFAPTSAVGVAFPTNKISV